MKTTYEEFKNACPEVDEELIREYLSRLGEQYFKRFSKRDMFRHLRGISLLSHERPVEVLVEQKRGGLVDCTVFAFDYPYVFSLITGILAGMGLSVLTGDVFTYERVRMETGRIARTQHSKDSNYTEMSSGRRRIIDHFSGTLESPLSLKNWSREFKKRIEEIIILLEKGDEQSIRRAKDRVSEWVVERLSTLGKAHCPVLYPMQIEINNMHGHYNRLKVVSEDTPAFLYALSNALSIQGIFIEHVRIRTIQGRVEDRIDLVDSRGKAFQDNQTISRIKLVTLFTKQFTYFLGMAPDPYAALTRFEQILGDVLRLPDQGEWLNIITNPKTMEKLARLLGTSDFLWEDFIRLQYETLIPMLTPGTTSRRFSAPIETIEQRLNEALGDASGFDDQREKLNHFKDIEIFLIDLDHILNPDVDFRTLSKRLTRLAECVVNKSVELVYDSLTKRFGIPRSVARLTAKYAILGMGKLGGGALGYASDIELIIVYSDNGRTDGENPIENSEFFAHLVRETASFIRAKREGIFHVDLRLRPYGDSGPLACSFENFCRYYSEDGQSHPFERLALVRLRSIGGHADFGARLERIRDELIYSSKHLDVEELRKLREKQLMEKTREGQLNAKFSPGGLVDLEYGVQILQVVHGKDSARLRTPYIQEALEALVDAGVLVSSEGVRLASAYDFFRKLINGMRMLRGSAKDLCLPPVESNELAHLARRMGYARGGGLDPAQQLYMDFETHTAVIRVFKERHFGQDSVIDPTVGTVADLILSEDLPADVSRGILGKAGFREPDRAKGNLKRLAGRDSRRDVFIRLALIALDILKRRADPDRALNNWERYIRTQASPEFHYNLLLSQPMRLEILLSIFSESQFLADTLVRNPEFLDWVMIPGVFHSPRKRKDIENELRKIFRGCESHDEWLNKLRRLRRREILRIGTRDICLGISTRDVMDELSIVAEAFVQADLDSIQQSMKGAGKISEGLVALENRFCVLAFGKLGGHELNYSSDIDLMGVWDDRGIDSDRDCGVHHRLKQYFSKIMERIRSDLSDHTGEGYAYRVDLRLRPYGREGELVPSFTGLLNYYANSASLWEIQASMKLRPIAGNFRLGYELLEKLSQFVRLQRSEDQIVGSIERMRNTSLGRTLRTQEGTLDIKNGLGGLRDVEFLVQGFQLIHVPEHGGLIEGNTLRAIGLLQENGILSNEAGAQLKEDYVFLRKIEHCLQILDDRQIHSLPNNSGDLDALAKRIFGAETNSAMFIERINECMGRVRQAYVVYLLKKEGSSSAAKTQRHEGRISL
jgi:glutamate-ammonia-ligase adenylyltransferase